MSTEFQRITQSLKMAIKAKGFTYAMLAKELKISEAGVKKLLNANDCSFKRIMEICRVIDIEIDQLIMMSKLVTKEIQHFTTKQIDLFKKSPAHLKFYYKLRVESLTSEEIKTQWNLSDRQTLQYLYDLDKVDLIKLLQGNKISIQGRSDVYWNELEKQCPYFRFDFTEYLLSYSQKDHNGEGLYPIMHFRLSDKSKNDFYHDVKKLIGSYVERANIESMGLKEKDLKPLSLAFLLAPTYAFQP